MKILIAILTCHINVHKADAQRKTWVKDIIGADVKFFLGRHPKDSFPGNVEFEDEVWLDCADDYRGLSRKTQMICQWALAHGYDYIFKCDDDVAVIPEKLLVSGFEQADYIGRFSNHKWAGGHSYWLSRKALHIVSEAEITNPAEDLWIGTVLENKVTTCNDQRYWLTLYSMSTPRDWHISFERGDNVPFEDIISFCSLDNNLPMELFYERYRDWQRTGILSDEPIPGPPPGPPVAKPTVDIIIHTVGGSLHIKNPA